MFFFYLFWSKFKQKQTGKKMVKKNTKFETHNPAHSWFPEAENKPLKTEEIVIQSGVS